MTIDSSAEIGRLPPRAPAGAGGASRALSGFLWAGSAGALLLTLAAAAMPALFALGGEAIDPQASQDFTRAVGSLSLAQMPSALAPKSARLQRTPRRPVEAPPVAIEKAARPEGRLARLIAPSAALTRAPAGGVPHWLERPLAGAATHFTPLLPRPEEVAAETLEDQALAEAKVASRAPENAGVPGVGGEAPAEAPVALAELMVPKPTFRPLAPRAEAPGGSDDDETDEAEAEARPVSPRLAPAPRLRQSAPPAAAPKRGQPASSPAMGPAMGPAMAYARPDAGALRLDPSAVDPPSLRPRIGAGTAIYDISASTVYLPNGERLEAHSGLGRMRDNPRFVHVKNRGPTPPHTYRLSLRESLFHGVQAIRLTPTGGEARIFNRNGLLAHTYMLGARGDSNGCVSFRDYKRFLAAFRRGEIRQLVVVERMDSPKSRFAWLFGKS